MRSSEQSEWTQQAAREHYRLPQWSAGYFDLGDNGVLQAQPQGPGGDAIELPAIIQAAKVHGLHTPLLIRFSDILRHRAEQLTAAFTQARAAANYAADYQAVYPIKVNQQRSVVEEVCAAEATIGLEAGSKPELIAVLAIAKPGQTIVCNGYKDREYLRLALIGRGLGLDTRIVIEKPAELAIALEEADALGVTAYLGIRVRLASIGEGRWQNTGGEKAKFGLTAAQLLQAVEQLAKANRLHCLRMLHTHMGSQIANLADLKKGLQELFRHYVALNELQVPLDCVDVGGGLAVDYQGGSSRAEFSMNYSLNDYAAAVVAAAASASAAANIAQPQLITEAGRAMVAHHAVLVSDVVDVEQHSTGEPAAEPLSGSLIEQWHDAEQQLSDLRQAYIDGQLSLAERSAGERRYFALCQQLVQQAKPSNSAHQSMLNTLRPRLADKLFVNLSLFQSLPDVWGIKQIFPIMPLERLNEEPQREAVVVDLTCDSDGRIDHYIDGEGLSSTLAVHDIHAGEPYLLGFFLVGAYQETLGDIHNLFGDTNAVDVRLNRAATAGFELSGLEPGDTAGELLAYVHFDPNELKRRFAERIDAAQLTPDQADAWHSELVARLDQDTYLKAD